MKTKITAGLTDEEKRELTSEFKASYRLRERLRHLLTKDVGVIYESMLTEGGYNTSNWSLDQANKIAEVKALKKLIALLEN